MNSEQVAITLRVAKDIHAALKQGTSSMSKKVDQILAHAHVDDVVKALIKRSQSDDVYEINDATTKVIVKASSFNNVEVMALKLGIPRDTVVRLLMENYYQDFLNPLPNHPQEA
jgi:hypothetical protein